MTMIMTVMWFKRTRYMGKAENDDVDDYDDDSYF
jgi:hypothetical protein